MCKQVNFYMTPDDEREFLGFIRSDGNIAIFKSVQASPEIVELDELPPRGEPHWLTRVWNGGSRVEHLPHFRCSSITQLLRRLSQLACDRWVYRAVVLSDRPVHIPLRNNSLFFKRPNSIAGQAVAKLESVSTELSETTLYGESRPQFSVRECLQKARERLSRACSSRP